MKYLHTMIRVSNLDQSLDFFINKLGFVEQARIPGYPNGHADIHFTKYLSE